MSNGERGMLSDAIQCAIESEQKLILTRRALLFSVAANLVLLMVVASLCIG